MCWTMDEDEKRKVPIVLYFERFDGSVCERVREFRPFEDD